MVSYMGETAAAAETGNGSSTSITDLLRKGPEALVDWLGSNDIRFGETHIATEEGKLTVEHGVEAPLQASLVPASFTSWWAGQPNIIKFGAPALLLLLLLRR